MAINEEELKKSLSTLNSQENALREQLRKIEELKTGLQRISKQRKFDKFDPDSGERLYVEFPPKDIDGSDMSDTRREELYSNLKKEISKLK